MSSYPRHSTSAQLRGDIDAGRTGDKTPGFDPAAAPLGTDEEAGGAPPTGPEVDQARRLERSPVPERHPNAAEPSFAPAGKPGMRQHRFAPWLIGVGGVIALVIIVALVL